MSCISQEDVEAHHIMHTEFLVGMRDMWAKSYRETAFLRDIPRLIKRTQVQTSDFAFHGPFADETTVDAIYAVLSLVSTDMDFDREQVESIRKSMPSDMTDDHLISSIFEQLGDESKLVKLLKLINQGVILYSMQILRETVCGDIMTKDVRTPEGWRICLKLGDAVQVVHTRIEQSLDQFGDTSNHFEFEWEVISSFDKDMQQLRSATIRIKRLRTTDTMDIALRDQLRQKIIEGLIVA